MHPLQKSAKVEWDDFEIVPRLAHEKGLKAHLYVTIFDEGWSLLPENERAVSYHNKMHCQHVSWQSSFSKNHPEYTVVDRTGKNRQWGVLCLAYKDVREHFCNLFLRLLKGYDFDGLFVCFRSQSKPANFGDQFGYNEPVHKDFKKRYGKDIIKEDFDLDLLRNLHGEYITLFLSELRKKLKQINSELSVGIPRGDVLGPPLGNTTLQWRDWIKQHLVDELIINQNSCQCPSMWHKLWPMHKGTGYVQNYLDGFNLPPLVTHLTECYYPYLKNQQVKLYIARQWDKRSKKEEDELFNNPVVSGLVFSSFRFDNPEPIARGNWVA